jgi:hypothetical protein
VTQALSLSSGQKLEAKADKCELHVVSGGPGSDLSIEFLTLKDLSLNPNNGPDYQMVTWLDAVMDESNSLYSTDISRCEVSADQIQLKYTRKQTTGWHSKFKYSVQISLKGGQITSAKAQGDNSDVESCVF